ncbi:hypothetical protein OG21DRAFT_954389 [Imleria badia]|nr:hypothetical protein OG21DRAFT_954389 [Imleria badia]
MSIPVGRKFRILSLQAVGGAWIGANNFDDCAVKPVIPNGAMKTWSIKIVDGVPRLVLDDIWYSAKAGDKVVVQLMVNPPTSWTITPSPGGYFMIKDTDADTYWTLIESEPKHVGLKPFVHSNPYQVWRFEFIDG